MHYETFCHDADFNPFTVPTDYSSHDYSFTREMLGINDETAELLWHDSWRSSNGNINVRNVWLYIEVMKRKEKANER